jgi:hypothetical protein
VKEFVTLSLRDKDYTFRALDLDQLEELEPQFAAASALSAGTAAGPEAQRASFQAVAEIATASLQYKHAGITVSEVRKLLTIATVSDVMLAIRGVSEVAAPGEGQAGGQ